MISGGGASSPLFMQTFADVFGLPATRSTGAAGASLGAAICAAAAAGIYPDIETAAARMTSERESFAPDRRQHRDLRADERDCLPGHQGGHRSAARALVSDLPLSPTHPKGRHHGTDQSRDRRGPAADPRPRERDHRREAAAAAEHRQLPQAREHLRRLHAAGARGGGDGAQHLGGGRGARIRRPAGNQRRATHGRHRDRRRARDDRSRTRSCSTARR